eukprot:GILK01004680.1.p1 GENE.GILK01004680.1~~GILK01004680.1.p1  ORF type:complete len:610 (-),score=174.34 GILK01004680.1:137-1966(-)
MEEVDNILLLSLRQIGCQIREDIRTLTDFDIDLLVKCTTHCLHAITGKTYPSVVPEQMSMRYRFCQSLVSSIQELGFKGEISFNIFIYPNVKDVRKLLSFLVEQAPKPEEDNDEQVAGANVILNRTIEQSLQKWSRKLWTPFHRPPSKSRMCCCPLAVPTVLTKFTKNAEDKMRCVKEFQPFLAVQASDCVQALSSILEAHRRALLDAQHRERLLSEDASTEPAKKRIDSLFRSAMLETLQQQKTVATAALPNLQDILKSEKAEKQKGTTFSHQTDFGQEKQTVVAVSVGATDESERLQKQEEELRALQAEVDTVTSELTALEKSIEMAKANIRQTEASILAEVQTVKGLEADLKVKKHTLNFLEDTESHIARLKLVCAESSQKLLDLAKEWETHRLPLLEEIRNRRDQWAHRREDNRIKVERIRTMREEMKTMTVELQARDETFRVLDEERKKLPEDGGRAIFIRKIMEIIKQTKKQKVEIEKSLEDIHAVQKDINGISETLKRTEAVTDEIIFRDAKKDKTAKEAYKLLAQLREHFEKVVSTIEETGSVQNAIRDLEQKVNQAVQRNDALNIENVAKDLAAMRLENQTLAAKAAAKTQIQIQTETQA